MVFSLTTFFLKTLTVIITLNSIRHLKDGKNYILLMQAAVCSCPQSFIISKNPS